MRHIKPILEEHIMGAKPGNTISGSWGSTLDDEQRAACHDIMTGLGFNRRHGFPGWSVYMMPTVGRPFYLELRYQAPPLERGAMPQRAYEHSDVRTAGPRLRRWVITDERPPRANVCLPLTRPEPSPAPPPNEKGPAPLGSDPSPFTAVATPKATDSPGGGDSR